MSKKIREGIFCNLGNIYFYAINKIITNNNISKMQKEIFSGDFIPF